MLQSTVEVRQVDPLADAKELFAEKTTLEFFPQNG
jgi:hypothetical protein